MLGAFVEMIKIGHKLKFNILNRRIVCGGWMADGWRMERVRTNIETCRVADKLVYLAIKINNLEGVPASVGSFILAGGNKC